MILVTATQLLAALSLIDEVSKEDEVSTEDEESETITADAHQVIFRFMCGFVLHMYLSSEIL